MCFKITLAQREYFRYQGVSAEYERRGYGSSRPGLAWANREKLEKVKRAEVSPTRLGNTRPVIRKGETERKV